MSRSHRKTPIVGITNCSSEKLDKKIWHKRWRTCERASMAKVCVDNFDSYIPLLVHDVSSVWDFGKDGKQYWSRESQNICAEFVARNRGQTAKEKASIKQRELHKGMAK